MSLRKSEEKFRAVFQESPIGIEIYDSDGYLLDINQASMNIFGIANREDIIGFNMFSEPNLTEENKEKIRQGELVRFEICFDFERIQKIALFPTCRNDIAYLDITVSPLGSKKEGTFSGYLIQIQDCTERKRAVSELEAKEERMRIVIQNMPFMMDAFDERGRIVAWNQECERVTGYTAAEILGNPQAVEMLYPTQSNVAESIVQWARSGDDSRQIERIITAKNGEERIIAWTRFAGKYSLSGWAVWCIGVDVTELRKEEKTRKAAEEEREALLQRQQMILQRMPVGCLVTQEDFLYTYWNPAAEQIFGYALEDVMGKHPFDSISPPSTQDLVTDIFQRLMRGDMTAHGISENVTKDGRTVLCEWINTPLRSPEGKFLGIISMCRDVTERKRAEETLRQSEERYRAFVRQSTEAIWRFELDEPLDVTWPEEEQIRHIVEYAYLAECNDLMARMYGLLDSDSALGLRLKDILPMDDERNVIHLRDLIRNGYRLTDSESFETDRNGVVKTFVNNITGIVDRNRLIRFWGTQRDITARKQAETRLRESEALYSSLVENLPQSIFRKDLHGRFTFGNQNFCSFLGTLYHGLLGKTDFDFFPHEFAERYRADDLHVIQTGQILHRVEENRSLTSDEMRYAQVVKTPLIDYEGNVIGIQGICWDITEIKRTEMEMKRLEEQLRQSQKMESIGRLAGGIAHDFNNLLMAIIGYSDLLLLSTLSSDASFSYLEEIRKAGQRASSLTAQLLAFSRRQVMQPVVLDLNLLVQDMKNMLQRLIGENIQLVTHLQPYLGNIKADRGQIEQVIVNLAINARDAMSQGGGRLEVETYLDTLPEEFLRRYGQTGQSTFVRLTVRDNGIGMDEAVVQQIFEPFYTTKEKGKGTGLGLSTVYGIVQQSGGMIEVSSQVGIGTEFRIYFPHVLEDVKSSEAVTNKSILSSCGAESLLVVEDEPVVRHLVASALRKQGYKVIEMGSGMEALHYCDREDHSFELLLTDVIMPGMSGLELYEHVSKRIKNLKVILMSGYTDDVLGQQSMLKSGFHFLQKPFTMESLTQKVREVLDAQSAD